MKAVQIKQYGGPEVLELVDIDTPTPKKGQVLVENHAASINPFDVKIASGFMKEMIPLAFPTTLGGDFSGIITKVGEDVLDYKTGDQVYGQGIVLNGSSGAFAEFVAVGAGKIAKKPQTVNFDQAAALPLVGSSAIQALLEYAKLQKGQKILIHGGAGGIGHVAIQIAKALGAYVATTVSSDDVEFAKSLGADEVIDYKKGQFDEILKNYDAVFDTVGGDITNKSFKVLKKGGVLVSMLGKPDEKLSEQYGVTGIGQQTDTNSEHLNHLTELVDSGKVKAHIDSTFSLEEVKEAFEKQNNHPLGKVVLHIK